MWKPLVLIILMMLIGTIGFHVIEGWSFLDCLYMTVITIFTVGFKEVRELSPQGQIFTIFVILGGAGTALFAFTHTKVIYTNANAIIPVSSRGAKKIPSLCSEQAVRSAVASAAWQSHPIKTRSPRSLRSLAMTSHHAALGKCQIN